MFRVVFNAKNTLNAFFTSVTSLVNQQMTAF